MFITEDIANHNKCYFLFPFQFIGAARSVFIHHIVAVTLLDNKGRPYCLIRPVQNGAQTMG